MTILGIGPSLAVGGAVSLIILIVLETYFGIALIVNNLLYLA